MEGGSDGLAVRSPEAVDPAELARFWFANYRAEPGFAELYGLAAGPMPDVLEELFCGYVRFVRSSPVLSHVRVDTWSEQNVAIYRALGFEVHARSREGDCTVWTMTRPIRPPD